MLMAPAETLDYLETQLGEVHNDQPAAAQP